MEETYLHNLVYIKGGAYSDVKKALRQWVFNYLDVLHPEFEFKLYKKDRGEHVIRADGRLDNMHFSYLVNYLDDPDFQFNGIVTGYMRLENWGLEVPNRLNRLMTQVYIPTNGAEPDEVYLTTTENETLCYSFAGRIKPVVNDIDELNYEVPDMSLEQLGMPYVVNVKKEQDLKNKPFGQKRDWPLIRFQYGLMAFVFVTGFSRFFIGVDGHFFSINIFLSFALVIWFFGDYQLLQREKMYFIFLGISAAYATYGCFLDKTLEEPAGIQNIPLFMVLPTLFLIIQKPTRFFFIQIMNREPVIDKPAPSIADFIYMVILWIGVIITMLLVS